jgi:hypothetical protein
MSFFRLLKDCIKMIQFTPGQHGYQDNQASGAMVAIICAIRVESDNVLAAAGKSDDVHSGSGSDDSATVSIHKKTWLLYRLSRIPQSIVLLGEKMRY